MKKVVTYVLHALTFREPQFSAVLGLTVLNILALLTSQRINISIFAYVLGLLLWPTIAFVYNLCFPYYEKEG